VLAGHHTNHVPQAHKSRLVKSQRERERERERETGMDRRERGYATPCF